MIKLHQLRDFEAIGRHRSLHAAARSLGLAQSALSRSLSQLEQTLGVSLVERRSSGVKLTEAGERFLRRAKTVIAELRLSREEAAQYAGAQFGELKVGLSPTALQLLLPKILRRFRQSWPDIRLTVMEGVATDLQRKLGDGSIDLYAGIWAEQATDPALDYHKIAVIERAVVARVGHPLSHETRLADILDAQWIQVGFTEGGEENLMSLFARCGLIAPAALTIAPSLMSAIVLLNSSECLAIVPRVWASLPDFATSMSVLPIEDSIMPLSLYNIFRGNLPLTPAAQTFMELIEHVAVELV